ncbi:MAG: 16S rRNA (guanine(527)-N(7))-methyltransferase RsmG [Calditrichaceae bacterium]
MKQDISLPDFYQFLNKQNIVLNALQKEQLNLFHKELLHWMPKLNLISSGDNQHIIERHFLPGFYYVYYLYNLLGYPGCKILDLGTGAGFPGVILAIIFNNHSVTLLDSSRKKTLFLKNVIEKLRLNINVICERAEKLHDRSEFKYDVIVARAVAAIPLLIKWAAPLLDKDGYVLTLKGSNYDDEFDNSKINFKVNELQPGRDWVNFSKFLSNKRMIRIDRRLYPENG